MESIENNNSTEQTTADTSTSEFLPQTQPANTTKNTEAYLHGFTDGVLRIEKNPFQQYIAANEETKTYLLFLNEKQQEKTEQNQKLEQTTFLQKQIEQDIITNHYQTLLCNDFLEINNKKQQENAQNIAQEKTNLQNIKVPYHILLAFVFMAIAVVYMSVDFVITYSTVAPALNIGGFEGLVLAIGIASLSFLIKPAFDRIVEKPYHEGKNKLLNHTIISLIAIAVLVLLFFLGMFRGEAFKQENKLNTLKNEIRQLEKEQLEENNPQKQKEIDKKKDEEQKLLNAPESDNKQTSLILSTLLFAIGGAVCLSIASHSLQMNYLRRQAKKALKKENKIKIDLEKEQTQLQTKLNTHLTEKAKAEKALELLDNPEILKQQIKQLTEEITRISLQLSQTKTQAQQNLYEEAYQRGEKHEIEGKLGFTVQQSKRKSNFNNSAKSLYYTQQKQNNEIKTTHNQYLHQQIRNMIVENFNEKNNP